MFEALAALGGHVVSHGVPAHPGSMLILARLWKTTIIGLPTCGAYSKATAVDLLLPWLLSGEPPTRATVARLAHGGILDRDQRFRFPATRRSSRRPADSRVHAVTWTHQPANECQAQRSLSDRYERRAVTFRRHRIVDRSDRRPRPCCPATRPAASGSRGRPARASPTRSWSGAKRARYSGR